MSSLAERISFVVVVVVVAAAETKVTSSARPEVRLTSFIVRDGRWSLGLEIEWRW